ncbi:phosphate signaling complex protein PhoU [Kineococcus glutinatus]|uniref:Phosphate-specific transport system accessory protein PhoU n=1 Tax=Kineococcus glutinatus TaxID=1070872 RepID=A0ABP9I5E2_9ACTN
MREQFQEELSLLGENLVAMAQLAESAVTRATRALLDADRELAETVIAADERIDELQQQLEQRCLQILARQQPVATDLRVVVTALRMGLDLERMGDLARHVAKLARLRHPASVVPEEMRDTVLRMGEVAQRIVAKTAELIATRDLALAEQLEIDDDEMDRLHRDVFAYLLTGEESRAAELAVDLTLLGRYYERFADHAVSVARRVAFLVTGSYEDHRAATRAATASTATARVVEPGRPL